MYAGPSCWRRYGQLWKFYENNIIFDGQTSKEEQHNLLLGTLFFLLKHSCASCLAEPTKRATRLLLLKRDKSINLYLL
jgi:hypothetical protein